MDGIGGTEWRGTMAFTTLRRQPCAQLMAPTGGTAAPGGRSLRVSLKPLQHQRPLARVLVVGQQPIPVQAREHVHLFQHVEQRRHGPAREIGLRGGAGVLATSVEVEVASHPLEGFVVEKPDDYLCHRITYSTNPHLAGVLRTARRPNRREHRAHPAMWLRTASAWLRRSLPARYGANNGATSS